jgi:hypothetical protein
VADCKGLSGDVILSLTVGDEQSSVTIEAAGNWHRNLEQHWN